MVRPPVNDGLSRAHPEYSRAGGGIRRPEVMLLESGVELHRFSSTKDIEKDEPTESKDWAGGSWWVLNEDYRKIISRYKRHNFKLGTTARSALAVQPSWSLMDVTIKAVVIHDMYVFHGRGSTQYNDELPNGTKVTLSGWADVTQIYIPEMRGVARRNLRIKKQKIISSHSFGF